MRLKKVVDDAEALIRVRLQAIDYEDAEEVEFLKKFEEKAQAFSVSENETKSLSPKLIPSATDSQ